MALYQANGRVADVAQEAIQMQTIVNLVAGGIGLAWVPESVMQFRRPGVIYRPAKTLSRGRSPLELPICETSLVWPPGPTEPALERFLAFVRAQK